MQATERVASGQLVSCFHCGEPVPPGLDLFVTIKGDNQPMCCPGCSAVASMIADSGLDTFYQQRTSFNERPDAATVDQRAQYLIYDDPEVAGTFSESNDDQTLSARLLLGGVTCAACTWLIEETLKRVPGVSSAVVNLASSRLLARGGTAYLSGNLEDQPLTLFWDGLNGDLHLRGSATVAIDQGVGIALGLCDEDIDRDPRTLGLAPDVGADEYEGPPLGWDLFLPCVVKHR